MPTRMKHGKPRRQTTRQMDEQLDASIRLMDTAAVQQRTVHSPANAQAQEKPSKPKKAVASDGDEDAVMTAEQSPSVKPKAIKPGLKAHQEVLAHIEHRIGKTGDAEQDALLQTLVKNLRWRMKPWAKVTVQYVEE